MAYKQISPQNVPEGGTGVSSNTSYATLCGGTTSTAAIQSIASVGTSGQVLTSNGAALPSFQAGGGVSGPGSSTDNALARWNGTGGDTLQDSTVIVNDNGQMTNASQPDFLGYLNTTVNNLTGDGTTVVLGDSDVSIGLTESFDQSSQFVPSQSGGAVFTSSVDGKYFLVINESEVGLTSSHTTALLRIIASNRGFNVYDCNVGAMRNTSNATESEGQCFVDMDISDTVTADVTISGSTKVVDLLGLGGSTIRTSFSGTLIC